MADMDYYYWPLQYLLDRNHKRKQSKELKIELTNLLRLKNLIMYCAVIFTHFFVFILLFINFIHISNTENVKKSVDDIREDNGETGEDGKEESMEIPVETEPANATCTRRQNSQMHEIRTASYNQFPFMAAIMNNQNEFLCSGSIVSNGIVLTTAKCTQEPINYVLVNTTSDKKDDTTVSLHIKKSEVFPSYTGRQSVKDIAIIYTEKHKKFVASKINLSNLTDPKGVNDLEALGFGLNADVGKAKELQYIGVELRSTNRDKCLAYIDCIETKVPTCFKDYGGPVIVNNQLFGIITEGSSTCSKELTVNYALNKQVLEFLPIFTFKSWLEEKIQKNEENELKALQSYPSKTVHLTTTGGQHLLVPTYTLLSVLVLFQMSMNF